MSLPQMTRYHQPCWELPGRHYDYTVWAPGPITHDGRPTGKTREHWQASWVNHDGTIGDTRRDDTLDAVLKIFPKKIGDKFRTVIEREETI